jgi:sterol desaturase/sphingolipid hydroxylase (fatty acid hydroxylase superfamily)
MGFQVNNFFSLPNTLEDLLSREICGRMLFLGILLFLVVELFLAIGRDWKRRWRGIFGDVHWYLLDKVFTVFLVDALWRFLADLLQQPASRGTATLFGLPIVIELILVLFLLDAFNYLKHYSLHRWFWPFHAIHHNQTLISSITHHRRHPLESVIRILFLAPFVWIQANCATVFLANTIHILYSMFIHQHSGISFGWFDRILVSPQYHRIHHLKEPNCHKNLAAMFPVLDQIFRARLLPKEVPLDAWLESGEGPIPDELQTGSKLLILEIGRQVLAPFKLWPSR